MHIRFVDTESNYLFSWPDSAIVPRINDTITHIVSSLPEHPPILGIEMTTRTIVGNVKNINYYSIESKLGEKTVSSGHYSTIIITLDLLD